MTNISITVGDKTIKKMEYFYKDNFITNNNQHALFIAKTNNCTITVFKSNKVLFQGNNAEEEVLIWQKINTENMKEKKNTNYYLVSIGSDEVGTGDYFGPVVVCSAYLKKDNISLIKEYKINDSKKLTDSYIKEIAPILFKNIPYSILVVNNKKYNEVINNKDMNLNKLKAILHKQAICNLLERYPNQIPIILDQFCSISNFNKYINDNKFSNQITFYTKAESKLASVAVASIMARYKFLIEFEKLSKKLNTKLLKGASSKVDEQGIILVNKYGKNILNKIAKLHFKNTKKILNKIE